MSLTDDVSRYQRSDIHTIHTIGRFEFDQWFIQVGMKSKGVGWCTSWLDRISLISVNKREYFIHWVR